MSATKRPWHTYPGHVGVYGGSRTEIIASCGNLDTRRNPQTATDVNTANAALIVLAVNHHDELVQTLENVLKRQRRSIAS
jgi:hypothetical protein